LFIYLLKMFFLLLISGEESGDHSAADFLFFQDFLFILRKANILPLSYMYLQKYPLID